ncbi:MAG: autoinducer binding domain-containing protein [Hydrogenophaga sp.]|nr:autoinducer binding domain-containing protein [Hydrogenophaga sp.]
MDALDERNVLALIQHVGDADNTATALQLFRAVMGHLGADSGVFLSQLRDDATRSSYRSLLVCDPLWAAEYAQAGWHEHDPWLRHATLHTEPIRASEMQLVSSEEQAFVARSAVLGFRSALIIPAPSCVGLSRVGVLCLGSATPGVFDDGECALRRVLARALAMELHRWVHRSMREELLARSRLTAADLELLRHEAAGHGSKVIGALLNVEAKTIDCRFQRINAKLGAPDRRTAVRMAKLYGLI